MSSHQETESNKSYHSLQGRDYQYYVSLVQREKETIKYIAWTKVEYPGLHFLNRNLNVSIWQKNTVRFLPVFKLQQQTL